MQLLKHFKELTVRPKNAQELKGLILQLAIQGKLTKDWRKENPTVTSSDELIKKIKEYNENQLRINNRRIKKIKIEEEVNLDLPSGWVQGRNFELFSLQKGKNPKDLSETIKKYAYQDIEALDRGNVRRYSNDEKAPKCTNDDILVVCDGSRSGLVLEGKAGIVGSTLAIIETPPFIKQYIKIIFLQDYQRANNNMIGAAIPHLDTKKLLQEAIGLPPLEEQKEIVKVVETLFKEVDQLEQLTVERITLKEDFVTSALNQLTTNNAKKEWEFLQDHFKSFFDETHNIKKLRETVLQLAVQGKLTADWREERSLSGVEVEGASILLKRIQKEKAQLIKDKKIKKEKALPPITEDEIPYELPEDWVWCRMGTVSDIQRGSSPRPKGDPRYFSETQTNNHWISIKDISKHAKNNILLDTEEYLTDLGTQYSRYVDKNELIVAVSGSTTGKCCLTGIDGYFYDGLAMVRLIGSSIDHQYHLMYYLQLYYHMNDAKFGAAFPNINTKFLNEMIFPFPPLEEQKAIVQKVNALMGLCDALEQEVKQSQEWSEQLMQSCLREVFEGKEAKDYKIEAVELGMVAEEGIKIGKG